MTQGQRAPSPGESFADLHPDALVDWDWEENRKAGLDPYEVLPKSTKMAHWRCTRGHTLQSRIYQRANGSGCRFCGQLPKPGTDLRSHRPDLAEEYSASNPLAPDEITAKSGRRVLWNCGKCGEEYTAVVNKRTDRGTGCPVCAGRVLKTGVNDLATLRPELAALWATDENGMTAHEVLAGNSKEKFAWNCSRAPHVHRAALHEMVKNPQRCNVCSGHAVVPGVNDLASQRPDLVPQWDTVNSHGPDTVSANSGVRVWWKCQECGHRSHVSPDQRGQYGCQACAGNALVKGVNDLASQRPDLAAQWAPSNDRTPEQVAQYSSYRATWICPEDKSHVWEAPVTGRTFSATGCPHCPRLGTTSAVEIRLRDALRAALAGSAEIEAGEATVPVAHGRRAYSRVDVLAQLQDGRELVVEYDGSYWHQDKLESDRAKTLALLNAGYLVVRVREKGLEPLGLKHGHLREVLDVLPYYGAARQRDIGTAVQAAVEHVAVTAREVPERDSA